MKAVRQAFAFFMSTKEAIQDGFFSVFGGSRCERMRQNEIEGLQKMIFRQQADIADAVRLIQDASEHPYLQDWLSEEFKYQVEQGFYLETFFSAIDNLPNCDDVKGYVDSMNLVSELQEQINFNDNYKDWLYSLNIDEDPQLTCLAAFKTLREQIEQLKKARDDMREVVMVKMDTLFRNYRANGNSKLDKKSFDSKVLGELRGKDHVPALELDGLPFEDDWYLGGAYDYSMDYSIPAYLDWEPEWEKDNGGFDFDLPDLKDLEGLCDTAEFEYLNGRLFEIAQLFGWEQKANDRLDEILSQGDSTWAKETVWEKEEKDQTKDDKHKKEPKDDKHKKEPKDDKPKNEPKDEKPKQGEPKKDEPKKGQPEKGEPKNDKAKKNEISEGDTKEEISLSAVTPVKSSIDTDIQEEQMEIPAMPDLEAITFEEVEEMQTTPNSEAINLEKEAKVPVSADSDAVTSGEEVPVSADSDAVTSGEEVPVLPDSETTVVEEEEVNPTMPAAEETSKEEESVPTTTPQTSEAKPSKPTEAPQIDMSSFNLEPIRGGYGKRP